MENMAHARGCWIPKTTNTHSEYVTLTAFQVQQYLHDSASMLRYAYIVCLVLTVHAKNKRIYIYIYIYNVKETVVQVGLTREQHPNTTPCHTQKKIYNSTTHNSQLFVS